MTKAIESILKYERAKVGALEEICRELEGELAIRKRHMREVILEANERRIKLLEELLQEHGIEIPTGGSDA